MLFSAIHVLLCQSVVKIMAANVVEVLCPSTRQRISPELISKECDTDLIIKVVTFTHSMIYLHFTARQEKVIQSSKSDLLKYYELTRHE